MRILQVHNFYQQSGGEDSVVAAEHDLLQQHGHEVIQYSAHNEAVNEMSRVEAAIKTVWNRDTYREIQAIVELHSPDVIHAHNTFPLVSPSLYYAAFRRRTPVVQTLHNYRLLCPSATLFRNGKICEQCLGALPYHAVLHNCYRGSKGASATVAAMLLAHRAAGTWRNRIGAYIALTEFGKAKFIEGGIEPRKIVVKPNFLLSDPGAGDGSGGYALFVGRLAKEKGLGLLLDAWRRLGEAIPLKIAGDGNLRTWAENEARRLPAVEILGRCERGRIVDLMKRATLLVVPSEWYEGLPMSIVEAFACGTPVVTSSLPSMDELVTHGFNGVRFENGSSESLAECVLALLKSPELLREMRQRARATYESNYTAERNYGMLMNIYHRTIESPPNC